MSGKTNLDFDDEVLARVAEGESLRRVCADLKGIGCPTASRFVQRVLADDPPGFAKRYARARELQWEAWSEMIFEEADQSRVGEKTKTLRDENGKILEVIEVQTGDNVERSRLKVDAMKWLLAKLHPKKYGDKLDLNSHHTEEITFTIKPASEERPDGATLGGHDPNGRGTAYERFASAN